MTDEKHLKTEMTDGQTEVKDTREDGVVGGGERLEIVQVAENSSDNFLKTEKTQKEDVKKNTCECRHRGQESKQDSGLPQIPD